MFERFTEQARYAVVLAQEEARALSHNYIGTEHILLGLMREEDTAAAQVLNGLDMTVEQVRAEVVRIVGSGEEPGIRQIPFTPRARKTLELALPEALSLGHDYIGSEHILLGMVREGGGIGMRILSDFESDAGRIRNATFKYLRDHPQPSPAETKKREEAERVLDAQKVVPMEPSPLLLATYSDWLEGYQRVLGELSADHPAIALHAQLTYTKLTRSAADDFQEWAEAFDKRFGPFSLEQPVKELAADILEALSEAQ